MYQNKRYGLGWVVLLASLGVQSIFPQSSTNYTLKNSVVDQGGGVSASPNYRVIDAIGQCGPVGTSASTGYTERSGFFASGIITTDVAEEAAQVIPKEFKLFQNYPNPFNPSTTIAFEIPKSSSVYLEIYNLTGKRIRTLIGGEKYAPGRWEIEWDGMDEKGNWVSSGMYLVRFSAGNFGSTRKLLLMK